jgi:hypothetical protein
MEKPELPPNFQEEMMNCELDFQSEINETNIRKLIYVYTLGMQYYNVNEKEEFENYYRNKLNNLLLNESVIKYLDTHEVDLSKKVDLNIFSKDKLTVSNNKKEEKEKKEEEILTKKESRDDTDIIMKSSFNITKKKNKIKKDEIIEYVKRKIKEVDIKLKRIDKQVSDNIVDQMAAFDTNKRNKKIRKKKNSDTKEEKDKDQEKEKEFKNESKIEENEIDISIKKKTHRRRGSSISQPQFLKEIEEYVEQNMKEMYKALEELKQSYEGEISEAVESGFDEIAESLRNDLKFEEENLTAQYEEERMKQIELIRAKYKKN